MNDALQVQPTWQKTYHLSLVTPNLDTTIRFYQALREILSLAVK